MPSKAKHDAWADPMFRAPQQHPTSAQRGNPPHPSSSSSAPGYYGGSLPDDGAHGGDGVGGVASAPGLPGVGRSTGHRDSHQNTGHNGGLMDPPHHLPSRVTGHTAPPSSPLNSPILSPCPSPLARFAQDPWPAVLPAGKDSQAGPHVSHPDQQHGAHGVEKAQVHPSDAPDYVRSPPRSAADVAIGPRGTSPVSPHKFSPGSPPKPDEWKPLARRLSYSPQRLRRVAAAAAAAGPRGSSALAGAPDVADVGGLHHHLSEQGRKLRVIKGNSSHAAGHGGQSPLPNRALAQSLSSQDGSGQEVADSWSSAGTPRAYQADLPQRTLASAFAGEAQTQGDETAAVAIQHSELYSAKAEGEGVGTLADQPEVSMLDGGSRSRKLDRELSRGTNQGASASLDRAGAPGRGQERRASSATSLKPVKRTASESNGARRPSARSTDIDAVPNLLHSPQKPGSPNLHRKVGREGGGGVVARRSWDNVPLNKESGIAVGASARKSNANRLVQNEGGIGGGAAGIRDGVVLPQESGLGLSTSAGKERLIQEPLVKAPQGNQRPGPSMRATSAHGLRSSLDSWPIVSASRTADDGRRPGAGVSNGPGSLGKAGGTVAVPGKGERDAGYASRVSPTNPVTKAGGSPRGAPKKLAIDPMAARPRSASGSFSRPDRPSPQRTVSRERRVGHSPPAQGARSKTAVLRKTDRAGSAGDNASEKQPQSTGLLAQSVSGSVSADAQQLLIGPSLPKVRVVGVALSHASGEDMAAHHSPNGLEQGGHKPGGAHVGSPSLGPHSPYSIFSRGHHGGPGSPTLASRGCTSPPPPGTRPRPASASKGPVGRKGDPMFSCALPAGTPAVNPASPDAPEGSGNEHLGAVSKGHGYLHARARSPTSLRFTSSGSASKHPQPKAILSKVPLTYQACAPTTAPVLSQSGSEEPTGLLPPLHL